MNSLAFSTLQTENIPKIVQHFGSFWGYFVKKLNLPAKRSTCVDGMLSLQSKSLCFSGQSGLFGTSFSASCEWRKINIFSQLETPVSDEKSLFPVSWNPLSVIRHPSFVVRHPVPTDWKCWFVIPHGGLQMTGSVAFSSLRGDPNWPCRCLDYQDAVIKTQRQENAK